MDGIKTDGKMMDGTMMATVDSDGKAMMAEVKGRGVVCLIAARLPRVELTSASTTVS